jgi:hypothetical protein
MAISSNLNMNLIHHKTEIKTLDTYTSKTYTGYKLNKYTPQRSFIMAITALTFTVALSLLSMIAVEDLHI